MSKSFSILIPTYNEHDNIALLLERIAGAITGNDYEVVFVDDDSRDGTPELIKALSSKYPARVVVRKDKKGLASAVVDGFGMVSFDTVVVMDADLQHPPEVIPALIEAIRAGADIAVASRYVPGGGTAGWSKTRQLISNGAIMLAHILLPQSRKVKDPMSGFFAFKKSVISGVTLAPIGYKVLLEMLVMGTAGKVAEVPFMFQPREKGKSKLDVKQEIEYLKHIFSLMQRSGELVRFLKFCLVGGSGVLVNEGLLWLLTDKVGLFFMLSSAIAIETSIITNFVLNHWFTFADLKGNGVKSYLTKLGQFNLVSLVAVGINLGLLWLFKTEFGVYYLIANLIGIAVSMLWNYIANNLWTWKR
ncbi:MAG: glycosyltransferase family 2 protein [Dehalococcoidia bacterium]|nr:MAG: glycosyltransferase family 2 protein [Dehalococcoidia bacterium]